MGWFFFPYLLGLYIIPLNSTIFHLWLTGACLLSCRNRTLKFCDFWKWPLPTAITFTLSDSLVCPGWLSQHSGVCRLVKWRLLQFIRIGAFRETSIITRQSIQSSTESLDSQIHPEKMVFWVVFFWGVQMTSPQEFGCLRNAATYRLPVVRRWRWQFSRNIFWIRRYADEADNSVNHSVILCCVIVFW